MMNKEPIFDIDTNLSLMRTYMSADRTMFAGIRTALTILTFVLVLLKMYHPHADIIKKYRIPLIILITINILILAYTIYHYYRTVELIQKKEKLLLKKKKNI